MSCRFQMTTLLLILTANLVCGQNLTHDETPAAKFSQMFTKIKKAVSTVIKEVLPYILDRATDEKFQVSGPCRNALFRVLVGLKGMKPWAIHMLDAIGKFTDGFLLGTMSSFGNYEQCVEIDVKEDKRAGSKTGVSLFRGQYCTVYIEPRLPKKPMFYSLNKRLDAFKMFENDTGLAGELTRYMQVFYVLPFRLGVCVPSACKAEDINKLANGIVDQFLDLSVTVPSCEVKEEFKIEKYQVPVICTFSVLILILICGTAVDYCFKAKEERGEKSKLSSHLGIRVLKAFSVTENFSKVLNVEAGAQQLRVLHGIRFYTMTWIILGHTYFHLNFAMLRNLKIALELTTDVAFNIIANANLAVENFFFISGLLLTFVSYELKERAGAVPKIWMFIIHRLWRFLPMQMAFIGFTMLLPWFGSGPLWKEGVDPMVEACRKDWWANMIFINNFYRSSDKACVSHSWYLAADIQIYFVTLIVIYLLFRRPYIGLGINFLLFLASVLTAGIYNYVKDLPPTMLFSQPDFDQRAALMKEVYYTPYHHLSSVCIGVAVGYFLRSSWAKRRIHPLLQLVAWILAAAFILSTLLGVHRWNVDSDQPASLSAVYAALSRVAWTLGVAWITWACSTGHGGIMTKLLCWNVLVPLSRLTFAVYLIHPLVQRVFFGSLQSGINARNYLGIFIWAAFTTVSYLLGIVVCICIESPFISLGSIIFEKHKERIHRHSVKDKDTDANAQYRQKQDTKDFANGHFPINRKLQPPVSCISAKFGSSNDGFICHL